MKLTPKQIQHLQALAAGERSAYPGLNLGILKSLSAKGLVKDRHEAGSIFSPANGIKWSLTKAGKLALTPRME